MEEEKLSSSIKSIRGNDFYWIVGENCTSINPISLQNAIGIYYRHYYVNGDWIPGTTKRKVIFTCLKTSVKDITYWTNKEYLERCDTGHKEYLAYVETLNTFRG